MTTRPGPMNGISQAAHPATEGNDLDRPDPIPAGNPGSQAVRRCSPVGRPDNRLQPQLTIVDRHHTLSQ